ncbi:MAG TPA: electron transfer flavoprotein subunit beta/FixA family protein, partial [Patescibacteria group bacterium]|nr:electron transfer flavoprotein subunit beta/FixA family protein [Patescibacteria group bacterium]
IVCINHVPDTEAKIKIGTDGKTIDKTGVNYMLSPYDEFAIEAALRLKEKFGGETIAMTLGGDVHKETLRKALAMGVEKAVLLKDDSVRDSDSIGRALAEEIKSFAPDVVLFGKQSIDYTDELLPGLVAEHLGAASVSCVVKLEPQEKAFVCEREIEGGHEVVTASLPVVISTQKGLNEPRYPSLKGIMAAKTKPIEERQPKAFPSLVEVIAMTKPPAKQAGKIVGTDGTAAAELVRLLHEEAKVI